MLSRFSLLFDLDGTLVDSDALHLLAFAEILEGAGRTIDERYYRDRIAGRPNDRVIAEAFPGASERERQVLAASKEALYIPCEPYKYPPGDRGGEHSAMGERRADQMCRRHNLTAGERRSRAAKHRLGWIFDLLAVEDEVARGKPDPLPYRTACCISELIRAMPWRSRIPCRA